MNLVIFFVLFHYCIVYVLVLWVVFDSWQFIMGWVVGFFDVDFLVKCIVMYGVDYGLLVKWEERVVY